MHKAVKDEGRRKRGVRCAKAWSASGWMYSDSEEAVSLHWCGIHPCLMSSHTVTTCFRPAFWPFRGLSHPLCVDFPSIGPTYPAAFAHKVSHNMGAVGADTADALHSHLAVSLRRVRPSLRLPLDVPRGTASMTHPPARMLSPKSPVILPQARTCADPR